VREVETKLQPACNASQPTWMDTRKKHQNFRVYAALMKSAVAISAFFGANFRTMATEKTW